MKRFLGIVAAAFVISCFLPSEPSGADRVTFVFDVEPPYRVPLAGSIEPPIQIAADGRVLQGAAYRLESLDPGIVRVDETGRGLEGVERDSASVRAVYQTATGTRDTVFAVLVVVSRVAVDPPALAFTKLRDRTPLRARAYDAKDVPVPNVEFSWSSSNLGVATVDDTGLVIVLDEGAAVITAEADGVSDSSDVTVTQVAAVVFVAPGLETLRTVGRSVQFIAQAWDSSGSVLRTARPWWSSSDTSVAQVDERTGLATATGRGTARIIARVGTAADTATLVVAQVIGYVTVTPGYDTLTAIADTTRLAALAFDSGGTEVQNASVAWTTSDPTVATVDQTGLVQAAKNGVVLVAASAEGQSAFAAVVVRQEVVAARIVEDHVTLTGVGATVQLSGAALDRNGFVVEGAVLAWRSRSECVAWVDGAGLVTARGGGETIISAIPENGGQSDAAALSVTGAPTNPPEIAFADRGIQAVCSDGNGLTVLSTYGWDPSWSPDGSRLAYTSYTSHAVGAVCTDIYTARADMSGQQQITHSEVLYDDYYENWFCWESFSNPAWSPDGTRIAMIVQGGWEGEWGIVIVNADGAIINRLNWACYQFNKCYLGGTTPTWSPDGSKLAVFAGYHYGALTIYIMSADATNPSEIWTAPEVDGSYAYGPMGPAWSPDGSQLAVIFKRDIWLVDADGSAATNLHSSAGLTARGGVPVSAATPAWSPDGTRLVFSMIAEEDYGFSLWLINRDGTGRRRLTSHGYHPSWRPTAPPLSAAELGTARTGSR